MAVATKPPISRSYVTLKQGGGVACPICGNDHVCRVSTDGDCCFCFRVSQGSVRGKDGQPIQARNGMGWLHLIRGRKSVKAKGSVAKLKSQPPTPKLSLSELKAILKEHKQALTKERLAFASRSMGLSEQSLAAFGIGWDSRTACYSFPMYGGDRKVCGIRLRSRDPKTDGSYAKMSVRGSTPGLFIPNDYVPSLIPDSLSDDPWPYCVLLPEGPTTSSAVRDLGFPAIGRPSNTGGVIELVQLLRTTCKQDVCIVSDRDGVKYTMSGDPFFPGYEGAIALAESIYPVCGRLRLLIPPKGTKDMRDWLKEGGTFGMLNRMLFEAEVLDKDKIVEKRREIETWRKRLRKVTQCEPSMRGA